MTYHNAGEAMSGTSGLNRIRAHQARGEVSGCKTVAGRRRIDDGRLHLYVPHGLRRVTWDERSCTELEIDAAAHRVRAAIDGEPATLDTPLRFRLEPEALRLLVPRQPD